MITIYRQDRKFECEKPRGYKRKLAAEKKVQELLNVYAEFADVGFIIYDEETELHCPAFVIDKSVGGYIGRYSDKGFLTF